MAKFTWKEGTVVSLQLRDGSYVLGQLLQSPYAVFYHCFSTVDTWTADAAAKAEPLFFCAIAKQFFKYSRIAKKSNVRPKVFNQLPTRWISVFHGSRKVTVWAGTPRERTFFLLSERPGGQLVEKHLDASGPQNPRVLMASIPLSDDATIDGHEMEGIWTYPLLNERLFLCKQLGRCVDPVKDLEFNRPPPKEYATAIDMLASHGTPEDWGYSSKPYEG